jgi:hypothetical protein
MSPLTAQIRNKKRLRRLALGQLSYPEKVRIVEKLREASLQISAVAREQGLRQTQPLNLDPS